MKASGRTYDPTSSPDAAASRSRAEEAAPARRFGLSGPSVALDPARHAFRADIADIALAGRVIASHYAEPLLRTCVAEVGLRTAPDTEATTMLRPGDAFAVLDCGRGLAWGYRVSDHLVGYVDEAGLGEP